MRAYQLMLAVGLLVANVIEVSAQPASSRMIRAGNEKVPDEYIVVLKDDILPGQVHAIAAQLAGEADTQPITVWTDTPTGFFVRMSEARAEKLSRHPFVKYVEENAKWYLSAAHATYVNPSTCDPTAGPCAAITDNRLWHLDRADQNYAVPNDTYSYCTTGSGVTVYVVDTGVNKFHQEFAPGGSRVRPGKNVSGDKMPADDPCMGFAIPPVPGPDFNLENTSYQNEVLLSNHGLAVASVLGGTRVGVAKDVIIVPIKVSRCDYDSARARVSLRFYQTNETMWRSGGGSVLYRAKNAGTTAATPPPNQSWPNQPSEGTIMDGTVEWEVVEVFDWIFVAKTSMIIDGLKWILSSDNTQGPKQNAIVSMSVFRIPADTTDTGVVGPTDTVEAVIRQLIDNGLTVIASANNQNGDACDTSPARLSQNNPDPAIANDVITVGGSMLRNRPWSVTLNVGETEANGGNKGTEIPYDSSKGVRDARWICGRGDSSECGNISDVHTLDPALAGYKSFLGGSNAGPCVTLFAPAKNLPVASAAGPDKYRDPRLKAAYGSGTSWSAPIAAGFAARILQGHTFTPQQLRAKMIENSLPILDPDLLNSRDHHGIEIEDTPNLVLNLSDVKIITHPPSTPAAPSGPTTLSVTASGTSGLSYQWYEVNADFDYAEYKRGAQSSIAIAGATSASYDAPASASRRAYWVRVTNGCGSADSDIAVVVPRPAAPSNLDALAAGTSVNLTWSPAAGAEKYEIQRQTAGTWTQAVVINAASTSFNDTINPAGGMVLYRVFALAGEPYLPSGNLAASAASNHDVANVNLYESVNSSTTVKAQHLIDLRLAVNALCDVVQTTPIYTPADLQLASLLGTTVKASDFTSLMTAVNQIRTHALVNLPAASFVDPPVAGGPINAAQMTALRNALQ